MSLPALLVIAEIFGVVLTSSGPARDVAHFPVVVMEDQFARPHKLSDLRGELVVLVFSDKAGAESSRELGAKLHVHYHPSAAGQEPAIAAQAPPAPIPNWPPQLATPDVKMIAIAVIGEVPNALKPMVRGRFRKVAPDGTIWLDFTDTMRKQFQVVPGVANVAVIDKRGQLRFTIAGNLEPQNYAQLTTVIDKLRRELPGGASSPRAAQPAVAPAVAGPTAPVRQPTIARESVPTRVR